MLRSESMDYYQLVLPRESAWEIINALGRPASLTQARSTVSTSSNPNPCKNLSISR
jgi:hypothetical protein